MNWLEQAVSRVLFLSAVTHRQVTIIPLGSSLPMTSSSQPGGTGGQPLTPPYSALLLTGFTWHPMSPPDPVSSYLTLSPLPVETGGLLSVALSLGSPPLVITQRPALRSPDFPPPEGGDRLAYSNQSARKQNILLPVAILSLLPTPVLKPGCAGNGDKSTFRLP